MPFASLDYEELSKIIPKNTHFHRIINHFDAELDDQCDSVTTEEIMEELHKNEEVVHRLKVVKECTEVLEGAKDSVNII